MIGQPYSLSCSDKFFNIIKAYISTSKRTLFQLKPLTRTCLTIHALNPDFNHPKRIFLEASGNPL